METPATGPLQTRSRRKDFAVGDIGGFLGAVLWNWWAVAAGIMIAIEPVVRMCWRGYDKWAATWLDVERRKTLARFGAVLALVVANYMAFHDAKNELRVVEAQLRASPTVDNSYPLDIDQKNGLGRALDRVHTWERFKIAIACSDNAAIYANLLADFINSHGWRAEPSCSFIIKSTGRGICFALSPNTFAGKTDVPAEALKLMSLLDAAKVPYEKVSFDIIKDGNYWLVVGLPK